MLFGKKKEEKTVERIPRDRLMFYNSSVKKKDGYDTQLVSFMPFDSDEIKDMSETKKWEYLAEKSVVWLRDEKKVIPSYSKEQDWERSGGASYRAYTGLVEIADQHDNPETLEERAPIKVFNNAFDKVILPDGYREKIIETVSQLKDHKIIFEEWGLGEKVKRGKGVNILFSGQSGTGKTWCGECIAEYLGTEAEIISVATFESKWTGESEKNVANLFRSLKGNNKVLILDEVDSFLSSRSGMGDHHQYYNKLTNQFLIELERHDGIVIMTTNRPVKLDKALQRRIDLVLDFPAPDKEGRKGIWKYLIPSKMPTEGVDLDVLASFDLNGGQIKNALFGAARKALVGNSKVTMSLFKKAIEEEMSESDALKNGKDHS